MSDGFRLAIDIGGTFTDGVLINEENGALTIGKVPTTPADLSEGFLRAGQRLVYNADIEPDLLAYIIHATTVATNAVLGGQGSRAGLLVTEGFRDILEIARQTRYELYNLQTEKPAPLIPRARCFEIPERLDYRGEVLVPLDEAAVAEAVELFRSQQVESIAVCFLHSYRNPSHEQEAAEIIRSLFPEVAISLSHEIAPEIREYPRASTTVTNAYVAPIVRRYLGALEEKLEEAGLDTDVHIMQSNGGLMTASEAKERAIHLLESGPAAGVAAAAHFAELMGFSNAISFDMGGTTAKVGLILDGQPSVLSEFEAGSASGSGTGLTRGSGYPVLAPVMDLVEVGAGGGSIAWIDSGGLMRVGPRSAGADPGPACYEKGGTEPTVTDADLVLGRLNPDYFLGGEIPLNKDAAWEAIGSRCARQLGIGVVQAAMGIIDIANAAMVQAMRLISVQRGYDPRDFALVATGGAGPAHANSLAQELGVSTVIIPPSPGVASALGMLVTDLRHDYRVTHLQPLAEVRVDKLNAIYEDFEADAAAAFADQGLSKDRTMFERYLDVRYVGQSWNLSIPVPTDRLTDKDLSRLKEAFDTVHEQRYGYRVPEEPVEIVNIGLSATGLIPKPRLREVPYKGGSMDATPKTTRQVYFNKHGGSTECSIFDRYSLRVEDVVVGPAVIEEIDATTVVYPGYVAEVASYGVLLIRHVESDRWLDSNR